MTQLAPDFQPLRAYLPPALESHLLAHQDLPPLVRAGLAAQLRDTLRAYAAYVSEGLVRAQLADPQPGRNGGAFWQGSLLFADLSGFTALSEQLSILGRQGAEEVSALVNQLFNALVAEVNAYQGTLLKFGGDALTVFFDAAAIGPGHPGAATGAALAMQRRMDAFAAVQTRAGTFPLRLRVGVHSGQVFAAEVGDGSHIELVVTGADVNRVARAQERAAPGEVVVSDETAALLEGARTLPHSDGFQQVQSLLYFRLPPAPPELVARSGPDDIATLALLARQIAALQPYMVRNLPRRFLSDAAEVGEFRPVSVLFANVRGFSELLYHLGGNATMAARLLNAYYQRAQQIIHHYDGSINKVDMYTHGDKLMVLFGAPNAHEDDPLRAVRCALDLGQALEEANREIAELLGTGDWGLGTGNWETDNGGMIQGGTTSADLQSKIQNPKSNADLQSKIQNPKSNIQHPLSQRIAITTGTVFAGRVGGEQRHEYTVMGPAVNLAARLMTVADDGTILLSPTTRAAVSRYIKVADRPPVQLKGLAAPIVPAAVVGIHADVRNRSASSSEIARAPLIGRAAEVCLLRQEAHTALSEMGRVLALVGEAGVGKTRLVQEVLRYVMLQSGGPSSPLPEFDSFIVECQSYERTTPYAAARELLRQLFALDGASTGSGADLASKILDLTPDLARFTPLLGSLLGIELEETPLTAALSPEQRHARSRELVGGILAAYAQRRPFVVIIDDLHWADASSLDLLAHLAGSIAERRVLLVLSYRHEPPLDEPWAQLPHCIRLVVGELSPDESRSLLAGLLGGEPPRELVALVEHTQGNPFFVEEVVRSLAESGTLERSAGTWRLTRPLDAATIPDSIEGVITARLDRLDDGSREVLQVASVIGRRFPHLVLSQVLPERADLPDHLRHLAEAGLIVAEQVTREVDYLFKHALTRDVAYEAILYARRRELHRRVAHEIERLQSPDDGRLGLLAYHYMQAEDWEPAFRYHLAAGRQAQESYANREALAFFETARRLAEQLHTQPALAAEAHERSGDVYLLLGEYAAAHGAYSRGLELLAPLHPEASEQRVRLHRLLATVEERRAAYDAAFGWLGAGMAEGDGTARDEQARCSLLGAGIHFRQGDYAHALEWAQVGLQLAEQEGTLPIQAHALKLVGLVRYEQGQFAASIEALARAIALFHTSGDSAGLSESLNNLGMVYDRVGDWEQTVACYEQSLHLSEAIGDLEAIARTANNLAVVLVNQGRLERAEELYRYSNEQFARIGSPLGTAVTRYNRGEVLLLLGRAAAALPLFASSEADLERIKARTFLPEVLRLAAEAHLALGDAAAAAATAARSLGVANELGMAVDAAVARRVFAQIALQTGDFAGARLQLDASRSALEQLDNRYELGKVLYWQARLARSIGADADAALEQAAQIFEQLDARRDLDLVRAFATDGEDVREMSF